MKWSSAMSQQRSRLKQHRKTFEEHLAEEAVRFREAAEVLHGTARELLLRRARQAEIASHISEWLHSPDLQPPTR
jgi:hypothetical protein